MSGHRRRLLVVEDDPDVCEVIRLALEGAGYEVACVPTGSEALARLRASRHDLALVDHRLPGGVSGAEIAEQATVTGTAVVLMSGHPDSIKLFERLPYPSLRKPFRVSAVLAMVKQALGEPNAALANCGNRL